MSVWMPDLLSIVALVLILLLGFAAQRAGLCAVNFVALLTGMLIAGVAMTLLVMTRLPGGVARVECTGDVCRIR